MHRFDSGTLTRERIGEARALYARRAGRLAVQIGGLDAEPIPPERFGCIVRLGRELGAGNVRAAPEALPLAGDSAELIAVVHALESCDDPVRVVAEAARILRGEGRLIVIGFRSLRARAFTPATRRRADGTHPQRALGALRVRALLRRSGLVWERTVTLGEPCGGGVLRALCRYFVAGEFAVIGVKREPGMTVLRPDWRSGSAKRHTVMPGAGRAG